MHVPLNTAYISENQKGLNPIGKSFPNLIEIFSKQNSSEDKRSKNTSTATCDVCVLKPHVYTLHS